LDRLRRSDPRVRILKLCASDANATLSKWFGDKKIPPAFGPPRPIRCQAGTPIFAFLQAIEYATGRTVLRADCDMLFFNNGWLLEAQRMLEAQEIDMLEPARIGESHSKYFFSSRAFVVDRLTLSSVLPLHAHTLDPLRALKRIAMGRPRWLALEQMIERERAKRKVRAAMLPEALGFSLHVATHKEASLDWFEQVPPFVERGILPDEQRRSGRDFSSAAWQAALVQPALFERGAAGLSSKLPDQEPRRRS
jgi:hypothetical protein